MLIRLVAANLKSRSKSIFLILCFFVVVASASYAGFAAKWGMRENCYRFTLERVLNGSAHRPYVYRQLVPAIANFITENIPKKIVTTVSQAYKYGPFRYYSNADANLNKFSDEYKFKWIIVYWIGFFSLLASLFFLREILKILGFIDIVSTLAPSIFVLCLPIIQSNGGFYYDFTELFFILLCIFLILKKHYLLCFPVVVLGAFNKETFFLFLPTLCPFLSSILTPKKKIIFLGMLIAASLSINLFLKKIYTSNPGDVIEWHLLSNLKQYISPYTYIQFDDSYGMFLPRGFNILILALIFILVKSGWKKLTPTLKQHAIIALMINYPLFLFFGIHIETRGLSFLYFPCVFLIAHALVSFHEKSIRGTTLRAN